MHYRLEPGNPRHILRVTDDGEQPFAVVFDPTVSQSVVDALNASLTATPVSVANIASGPVNGNLFQIGHVARQARL